MKKIIIAIDGRSSCGKSTLAKDLAKHLNYRYIDTGAMYRAVALYCIRKELLTNGSDPQKISAAMPEIKIDFKFDPVSGSTITYLNGENVEDEIRGFEVSGKVSTVSQISAVRKILVEQQQQMGEDSGIVMDGRDIGTRVFPNAELKLFITADTEERVDRRYNQMKNKGIEISREEVRENLKQRDFNDEHKGEQPLKKATDAVEIDNTKLTVREQFEMALDLALQAINNNFQEEV